MTEEDQKRVADSLENLCKQVELLTFLLTGIVVALYFMACIMLAIVAHM